MLWDAWGPASGAARPARGTSPGRRVCGAVQASRALGACKAARVACLITLRIRSHAKSNIV